MLLEGVFFGLNESVENPFLKRALYKSRAIFAVLGRPFRLFSIFLLSVPAVRFTCSAQPLSFARLFQATSANQANRGPHLATFFKL